MIKSGGHADLPLHGGIVPKWLADRMMVMGTLITESLVDNFGSDEVLVRLSDPMWFQSFGAVLGMDWHSSGITTSVMYALKRGINSRSQDLGLYVCGGRGKYSRLTPNELLEHADRTGLNGDELVDTSKLCAKIDNNAVQDGFQLYQHNFIVSRSGNWTVIQQGMNTETRTARRYHWSSSELRSFVENPHSGVVGENRGRILNLTDTKARTTRDRVLELSLGDPEKLIREINQMKSPANQMIVMEGGKVAKPVKKEEIVRIPPPSLQRCGPFGEVLHNTNDRNIVMPAHHDVRAEDIDLKRLGGVLATAYATRPESFEKLMLTPGLGPRTLQSLTLVSEIIYGTPSRFTDPARFSFAHGGKDGHPFPVPLKVYDESIRILGQSIEKSKLGDNDKTECLKRLHQTALYVGRNCQPEVDFDKATAYERSMSPEWEGRCEC